MSTDGLHLPIEYFLSIDSLAKIYTADHVFIQTAETFQKNSLRNRCYLTGMQGKIRLSVPLVKGKHQQQNIRDVQISYAENWPLVHIKTIATLYRRSPFFDHYFHQIENIVLSRPSYLIDLTWRTTEFLMDAFKIDTPISCTLEFCSETLMIEPSPLPMPYPQLFESHLGFISGLSALDLLFCMGPQLKYLT